MFREKLTTESSKKKDVIPKTVTSEECCFEMDLDPAFAEELQQLYGHLPIDKDEIPARK